MDKKVCTKCGELKSLTEFHNNKSTKDKLNYICKQCCKEWQKNYRPNDASKDKVRAYIEKVRKEKGLE